MAVGIAGMRPDAVTQALLMGNYIPLKPEGVRVRWYAVTQDGGPLFAWGCESDGLAGWGGGHWPTVLWPKTTAAPEPFRGERAYPPRLYRGQGETIWPSPKTQASP